VSEPDFTLNFLPKNVKVQREDPLLFKLFPRKPVPALFLLRQYPPSLLVDTQMPTSSIRRTASGLFWNLFFFPKVVRRFVIVGIFPVGFFAPLPSKGMATTLFFCFSSLQLKDGSASTLGPLAPLFQESWLLRH